MVKDDTEFKQNARLVSAVFEQAGVTSLSLEAASKLLPNLKEWDEFAKAGRKRLRTRVQK